MPSPDLPIIQAVQKCAGNLNKHFIGGKFVSGVGRDNIVSVNPSNGAPFAEIQAGSFKDINTAVQNAHECFENVWSKITPHEREKTIRKISAILEEKMDFISALDALDAGLVYSTLRTMGKAMLIEAVENDHVTIDPMVPFGGVKDSGIGREFGEAGYKSFLEMKTLSVCY